MAITLGKRQTVKSGPASGVLTTPDPLDAGSDKWLSARNVYIPAPTEKSDTYARPGFTLLNNGNPVATDTVPFKGQGIWTQFDLSGTAYNFIAMDGKLFRQDPATGLTTDVSPVGITIDPATTTRVYFGSMGGTMAVSDGVNRPWVASNLASTPITGTYIDFDGMGTAWVAFGPPEQWGGSGFFVLTSVNSVGARLDIVWSEPNDWTTGYQQTNFDNRWTLEQSGTTPIYGLSPTNTALYYFRQRSIGAITGTVGPDLASTATHDLISNNIGSEAPQTIVQFGGYIYFCDVIGRPNRFAVGSVTVETIWHQLRGIVDTSSTGFPGVTALTATGALEPTLNQYCVAIWSPVPGGQASPTEWYAFDAATGIYVGPWSIGPTATGVSVDCLGSFVDNQGRGALVVLGSATTGGTSGYAWSMSDLSGVPDLLVLEDLTTFLTDESTPGVDITTEGQAAIWMDNGQVPLINVQTDRLGYSEDIVWLWDQATILTGSQAPISVTIQTPLTAGTVEGTPTPTASQDGIYRTQMGLDLQGREAIVTVSPTTADSQWSIARVSVVGIPSAAQADDQ